MTLNEAEELLPWAIAGTLSVEEAKAVQAFIDSGDISQEQIAELEFLSTTVKTVATEEPKYNPAILQNVMSQLDSVPQTHIDKPQRRVAQNNPEKPGLFAGIAEFLQWSLTPAWAKVTIAAQLSLLVAVVAFYGMRDDTTAGVGYETAAGGRSGDFNVIFAPESSAADIGALLQQYRLTIIDGPSALGLYTLDAAENADLQVLQSQLSESSLTNYVQPLAEP